MARGSSGANHVSFVPEKRRKETALAPRVPGNHLVCYTGEWRFSLEYEWSHFRVWRLEA